MTAVVQEDFRTAYSFRLWPLLTVLPLIIAAGTLEDLDGRQGPLGEGAYRSLPSDPPWHHPSGERLNRIRIAGANRLPPRLAGVPRLSLDQRRPPRSDRENCSRGILPEKRPTMILSAERKSP